MNKKDLALASILAALYAALGLGLAPISYLMIQCRIADALYPLIALFGWPALIGLTIGQFITNLASPLGFIDLLSPILFLPAKYFIKRFGFKAVPIHVLSVALWVALMLNLVFGLPYWITVIYVGIGEAIAELVLGGLVYRTTRATILARRIKR